MLQNISVGYDPVEDRLVLRLTVQGQAGPIDHWLLLTRRVCATWRQDLQAMVDVSAQAPARLDSVAKAVVSGAHHQAMAAQIPLRVEPGQAPQPDAHPTLVVKVTCGQRRSDGRWVVKFELRNKSDLTLVLSSPTLHAMVDAVSRRIQMSGWALPTLPTETLVTQRNPDSPLH